MASPPVNFDVLLRAAGTTRRPTTGNIAQCRPNPESIEKCHRWLSERGVSVNATDFGLACSASEALFESLFETKLVRVDPASSRSAWQTVGPIRVPSEIAPLVEQI